MYSIKQQDQQLDFLVFVSYLLLDLTQPINSWNSYHAQFSVVCFRNQEILRNPTVQDWLMNVYRNTVVEPDELLKRFASSDSFLPCYFSRYGPGHLIIQEENFVNLNNPEIHIDNLDEMKILKTYLSISL